MNFGKTQLTVYRFLSKKVDGASDWDQHWSFFVVPISETLQHYWRILQIFRSGAKVASRD